MGDEAIRGPDPGVVRDGQDYASQYIASHRCEPGRPLEAFNCRFNLTRFTQDIAQIVMTVRAAGSNFDCPVVGLDRFVQSSEVSKRVAEIDVGTGMVGTNPERHPAICFGFARAAEIAKDLPEIAVGCGECWAHLDSAAIVFDSFVVSP